MSQVKTALKPIAFLLVFAVLLSVVQRRFTPRWDYPTHYSRTGRAVDGIYHEPRNSLDVLWVGTSHMQNAASPMILYHEYGIRSYNLATTGQPLPASYYRLKSVLKEQSPKVVIIDIGYCMSGSYYHRSEIAWRKIIDSIPFSHLADKLEMTRAVVKLNPNKLGIEDVFSGILPILRFHTNFIHDRNLYIDTHRDQIYAVKGQACTGKMAPAPVDVWADPKEKTDAKRTETLTTHLQETRTDLQKIVDLCRDKGCDIVFTKTPVCTTSKAYSGYWNREKHDLVQEMADSMGVPFIDGNYEDIGIDWNSDTCDKGKHLNMRGSAKFTGFFGRWLKENYEFTDDCDPDLTMIWDEQADLFYSELEFWNLQLEYDLKSYLGRLEEGNYTVFAAVCETIGDYWSEELQGSLYRVLGSQTDLREEYIAGSTHMGYTAIASNGQCIGESFNVKNNTLKGQLEDGTLYEVRSKYSAEGSTGTIIINGDEVQTGGRGIHFVVYDNAAHCIVDSSSFDTQRENCPGKRDWAFLSAYYEAMLDFEYNALKDLDHRTDLIR